MHYERDGITQDILNLLDDERIKNKLAVGDINAEMVRYIIKYHLYNILDDIKRADILEKQKSLENSYNPLKDDIAPYEYLKDIGDDYRIFKADIIAHTTDYLLNSLCYIIIRDIIVSIYYIEAKNKSVYLKDLKKCKNDIERLLKDYFKLPRDNSKLQDELIAYKCVLNYVFYPCEIFYIEMRKFYKTYKDPENKPLSECINFNQITGLDIKHRDFIMFKDMVYSYISFDNQIDIIQNGIKDYSNFIKDKFLIFNTFFKLGIKNEIDKHKFFNLIKHGYKSFFKNTENP